MKEVLEFISQQQQEFAQLPLFQFLSNSSIDPRFRLSFAPWFSPFVMGFGELNKVVFREEPTSDPIQAMINQHTYEDDSHWIWFLEDLRKLEFDLSLSFSDVLKFLWSQEIQVPRQMIYQLYRYTYKASPLQKLVIIEAIEATADVFLSATKQAALDLQAITQEEYRYFGSLHFAVDSGHSMHSSETEEYIATLPLTATEQQAALKLVEQVFELFTGFFNELLAYINTGKVNQFLSRTNQVDYPSNLLQISSYVKPQTTQGKPEFLRSPQRKRLGTHLIEAGLLTSSQLDMALQEQSATTQRLGEVLSSRGWVNQQTIEYMMEKVILPESNPTLALMN